jgi:protein involved in polysaccharide export with SLBB domain
VQLVETREKLEGLLLRRKNLQRQIDREETAEKKEILSQHLKAIDDATAEESQKLVKIERQFEQSRREDYARTLAAVAGWEQSGEKRRMLESLWEELDELLKARDEMFKQAAQQTNSKDRRPFEANIERLDATRVQIAQRIDELLNPVASRSVAATTEQEERLGIQLEPQHLAEMIFQNDPLIAELKRTLAKKELVLAQVRSSGATPEALKAAHHEVLQIEELIEELKSDRMPALLELLGSGNTQASPRTAGSQPFSGRIRPGDILGIEIAGGIPDTKSPATRTVEPDGNVVLGAVYGSASRVNVGGKTLIEAGQAITEQLRDVLRNPQVVVTYEGHDDGVIAEGAPAAAAISQPAPANAEPVVLQPLDTIEVIVPLSRTRAYLSDSFDKPVEIFAGKNPPVSGTYVIEPDGRVALPEAGGRVKLGGLNETEASKRLREHLSAHLFPRLALPSVTVLRRGRAVFPEGKQPTADYRIAPGDTVLASTYLPLNAMVIDAQGRFPLDSWNGKPVEKISVAGLTLEEAQAALRKAFLWKAFPVSNVAGTETDRTAPWILTLGGWREEADPEVIDLIEGTDATQLLRMQQEMEELKSMIQRLQAK